MNNKMRVIVFILILFLIGTGSATAYQLMLKEVTVIDNNVTALYKTPKSTVESFLQEQSILLNEHDKISVSEGDNIVQGMQITITRAVPVNITIDNSTKEVYTTAHTIQELLKEQEILLGEQGEMNTDMNAVITPHMNIQIKTYREETQIQKENIPFETQIKLTSSLKEGQEKVIQEGKKGVLQKTIKITYFNGQEQKRELVEEKVIEQPQNKIVKKGKENIIEAPGGKTYQYTKVIKMSATAYTCSYKDTGKSPGDAGFGRTYTGTIAKVGTVAVDPKVIPLGTKLYVEGYGEATAEDIGGAVKGNKIDLYVNTQKESDAFGRQNRTVYILADQ